MGTLSALQQARLDYRPKLPKILNSIRNIKLVPTKDSHTAKSIDQIAAIFPHISHSLPLKFEIGSPCESAPLRVGVVLSGGQAPGGHNVIGGVFDALKALNADSSLFGFLNGPIGIIENRFIEITKTLLSPYRNQGGFDLLGSGRDKIESENHLKAAEAAARGLNLDGLIIIGGDDSNTNAAVLAEYFAGHECRTVVVGVPKTIDGDLKNESIEISFGFDTACKTYAAIIGDLMRDTLSAKKSYYFIKLMGRAASHIALECALQTHPNMTLISEEISSKKMRLQEIVYEMCDMINARSLNGKEYGIFLIPEGVIEFIPEIKTLIQELNAFLANDKQHADIMATLPNEDAKFTCLAQHLSVGSSACFKSLPKSIREQLLLSRDPHGNVQVSKIETERLFIDMVASELKNRHKSGAYSGKFSAQPYFCGYEGRSCLPSNFDCQYCYALGQTAVVLVNGKANGYMSCIQNLTANPKDWKPCGIPLITLMTVEQRHGMSKPVIKKALVEMSRNPFKVFEQQRVTWSLEDDYISPGPIQFFGPADLSDRVTKTLMLESQITEFFKHK